MSKLEKPNLQETNKERMRDIIDHWNDQEYGVKVFPDKNGKVSCIFLGEIHDHTSTNETEKDAISIEMMKQVELVVSIKPSVLLHEFLNYHIFNEKGVIIKTK